VSDDERMPPLPWWDSREARRAARAERRRERHDARDARHDPGTGRVPLDPDRIVAAALHILDSEGLAALTIRRLATELGTGAMTLYWYVQNKDELLDLVADRVTTEVTIPADGTWRERAEAMALSFRDALLRHPAALPYMSERPLLGPGALRIMDAALGVFLRAGFSDDDAADAYFTVANYVTGFSVWQASAVRLPGQAAAGQRDVAAMARDYVDRLPADRYPNLVPLAPRIFGARATLDQRFRFGLACLLDGLEVRLGRSGAASRAGAGPAPGVAGA